MKAEYGREVIFRPRPIKPRVGSALRRAPIFEAFIEKSASQMAEDADSAPVFWAERVEIGYVRDRNQDQVQRHKRTHGLSRTLDRQPSPANTC